MPKRLKYEGAKSHFVQITPETWRYIKMCSCARGENESDLIEVTFRMLNELSQREIDGLGLLESASGANNPGNGKAKTRTRSTRRATD